MLLAASFAIAIAVPAAATAPWLEAKSEHFTLAGDVGVDKLREVANELERIRIVLRQSPGAHGSDPALPVIVVVTETAPSLETFGAKERQAGWFTRTPLEIQIAMRLDTGMEATKIAYHEYHHLLLDRGAPNAPHWIHEGLSQLWQSVEIGRSEFEVRGTRDLKRAVRWLRAHGTMPMHELFNVREDRLTTERDRFYMQSLVLLHMLYIEDPEGPAKVERFLREVGEGVKPFVAARNVWGPPELLEARLKRFLVTPTYGRRAWPLEEKPSAAQVVVRPMSVPEVLSLRGRYLLGNGDMARGKQSLVDAIVEDPSDIPALTHLALMSAASPLSFELLERAAGVPEAGFEAHWMFALRATSVRQEAASPDDVLYSSLLPRDKVIEHLEKSIALAPGFAPPYVLLARYLEPVDLARATELMKKAAELEPETPSLLLRLGRLQLRAGDKAGGHATARLAQERAETLSGERALEVCVQGMSVFPSQVREACERAVNSRGTDAARLARAKTLAMMGDLEGAAKDVERLAEGTSDAAVKARREGELARLREGTNPYDAAALEIDAVREDLTLGRLR